MINNINFESSDNIIIQNKNNLKHNDIISVSDSSDEYTVKCFEKLSTTRIGKSGCRNDIETIVKEISYKYKELLDELENEDLKDDEKRRKTEILNNSFSQLVQMEFSSNVFEAKESEERDYYIASSNKNSPFTYNNEVYDNIIKNHKKILTSLDRLENILKDYGKDYCNVFIDNVRNNSVKDSVGKGFDKIKKHNIGNLSYEDAVKISLKLYDKHNLYKYDSLFDEIEYGVGSLKK